MANVAKCLCVSILFVFVGGIFGGITFLYVFGPSKSDIEQEDLYCGKQTCYAVLGIEKESSDAEIRRAYRKLAVQLHPDKNRDDPSATENFRQLANAYEVLRDTDTRLEYDYSLDHPEERLRNQFRYYQYRSKQTNPYYVVIGFILFVTVADYFIWLTTYKYYQRALAEDPRVLEKMRAAAAQKLAAIESNSSSKIKKRESKRSRRQKIEDLIEEDDPRNYFEVIGSRGRLPTFWDLLIFRVPKFFGGIIWSILWFVKFFVRRNILKAELNEEEKTFVTADILRIPSSRWETIPEDEKERLVKRELWIPENFLEFKREYINSSKKNW